MYEIVRYYAPKTDNRGRLVETTSRVMEQGLTLEEARAHCQDESTHKPGKYFDGYREQ